MPSTGRKLSPETRAKMSASHKARHAKIRENGTQDKFRSTGVPVKRPIVSSVFDMQRSFMRLVDGLLVNSDLAYRKDRVLQRQMRNDPDVMGPLFQRQLSVALLDWDVVPQDAEDEKQVAQAEQLKSLVSRNLRRYHDFIRQMQEAVWYGPSAVNMIYANTPEGVAPVEWIPFHSDTLAFNDQGQLGIRVGTTYDGTRVSGPDGQTHLFSKIEREACVLHTFMKQAPDYEVSYESRYMFAGRGLRDVVWYQWLMKQTALQLWMTFTERYGMGMRVAKYPMGNDPIKDALQDAIENAAGDVTLLLPYLQSQPDSVSFEIMDPAGGGRQNTFADLIEGYLAGQIKELIIGQTATTEATATGLGSDVGTRHAETFQRLIKSDAVALADSLTHDFLAKLHRMNFGDTPHQPTWEFNVEDVDSQEWMQGVKDFVDLGGKVVANQVRGRLGLDEPKDDEDILERQEAGGFGDGGFDFGGAL